MPSRAPSSAGCVGVAFVGFDKVLQRLVTRVDAECGAPLVASKAVDGLHYGTDLEVEMCR